MYVIKASGKKEEFNPDKILGTLRRAGADENLAKEIVAKVQKKIHEGTTTKEILDSSIRLLRNKNPGVCARYDLKRAIMSLGPTGFPFEIYFSEILKHYGYKTRVGTIVKGKATRHEIDVIAKKDSKTYMVELKYHNLPGIYTKLKVPLYVYARFLDVRSQFDQAWIGTNTKLSGQARMYSKFMKIKVTSWEYPKGESLSELIEGKKLYPVTILKSVGQKVKFQLYKADLMLAKDLLEFDIKGLKNKLNLPEDVLKKMLEEAGEVCEFKNLKKDIVHESGNSSLKNNHKSLNT